MMKAWEFLLQKEGDQTWLPLETPTVEILEGRYRIVVRTPCQDETVDIYIGYVSTQDDPPKRRVQQRSRKTNPDGLMAFLPFTTFRTGRWELRCRPHVEPGSFEPRWPATIELQVLEQDVVSSDDLFGWDLSGSAPIPTPTSGANPSFAASPDLGSMVEEITVGEATDSAPNRLSADSFMGADEPVGTPPVTDAATGAATGAVTDTHADIQQLAEQMSRMVVDSVLSAAETLAPVDSSPGADVAPAPAVDTAIQPSASPSDESISPLLLYLQQEMITLGSDRQIQVTGELQPNARAVQASAAEALPPLIVTAELRDPNTTDVWDSQRQMFSAQSLSTIPFSLALTVPTSCASPLLLGTATLWQQQGEEDMTVLSSAQFTVMAPVETLLSRIDPATSDSSPDLDGSTENVSSQPEGTVQGLQQRAASNFVVTKMGMEPTAARANRQVNTDLLGLLGQPPRSGESDGEEAAESAQRRFRPVAKQQLPPKLEPRVPEETSKGAGLDLPSFGKTRNPVFQWTPPTSEENPAAANTDPDPDSAVSGEISGDASSDAASNAASNAQNPTDAQGAASEAAASSDNDQTGALAANSSGDGAAGDGVAGDGVVDEFAIPEEATLEELAELFGAPPPDLGMPDTPDLPVTEAVDAASEVADPDALENDDAAANIFQMPDALSATDSPGTESQLQQTPDDPLGSAMAQPADAQSAETQSAETQSRFAADDPLLNRMHELVVPQPQPLKESPALLTEVVVDDEDLPPTRMAWMQPVPETASTAEISIATPEMILPEGDLVVGETVRVLLRVPTQPPQLCARIWMLDCQSRTLLTEPQWVNAFLPLTDDQLEATVELNVPEGSIELQVEAIAVDPNSQRESRKVALRRTVVLADSGNSNRSTETDRFNPWMK